MGYTGNLGFLGCCATLIVCLVIITEVSASISHDVNVDRCRDDSFCKAYCLSTNPETVSARCGSDLSSCICVTPDNHAVKVRFVEERNPVPPTQPTTTRPVQNHYQPGPDVQYVNSQSIPNSQYYYSGNHNSIAGGQQQQPKTPPNPPPSPVLLECDASEASTRTCHLFCTMEIKAWYGLCNVTSKACACFGVPLSAVQTEPIAALFHSTAPAAPTPPPTRRPAHPPRYPQQQQYSQQPNQQQYSQQPNQQQWRPVQPQHQTSYPYQSSPSILNQAPNNQLQEQGPIRTAPGSYGHHGQTATSSFTSPPVDHGVSATAAQVDTQSPSNNSDSATNVKVTSAISEDDNGTTGSSSSSSRKRRSLNDMAIKGKESSSQKDLALQGDCSKFKCGISCKRSNYLSPDCTPKCVEGQCMCECLPRL